MNECGSAYSLMIIVVNRLNRLSSIFRGSPHVVMANMLDYDIIVSKFKHQSCFYVHFWTNTLRKSMKPFISLSYRLKGTIRVLLLFA